MLKYLNLAYNLVYLEYFGSIIYIYLSIFSDLSIFGYFKHLLLTIYIYFQIFWTTWKYPLYFKYFYILNLKIINIFKYKNLFRRPKIFWVVFSFDFLNTKNLNQFGCLIKTIRVHYYFFYRILFVSLDLGFSPALGFGLGFFVSNIKTNTIGLNALKRKGKENEDFIVTK